MDQKVELYQLQMEIAWSDVDLILLLVNEDIKNVCAG